MTKVKKRKLKTKTSKTVSSGKSKSKYSRSINAGCLEKSYKRAPQSTKLLAYCTCRCQASFIEQQCHTKLGPTDVKEGTDECKHCGYYVHWAPAAKEWIPTDLTGEVESFGSCINSGITKAFNSKDSMIIDFLEDFNTYDDEKVIS